MTGDPTAPVQESNVRLVDQPPPYPGIRFVFNVVDDTSPSYTSAIRYVGFDNVNNGSTSPLCNGGKARSSRVRLRPARQDGRTPQPAGLDLRLYSP